MDDSARIPKETKRGRRALAATLAMLLGCGAFAGWWYGVEAPKREAEKQGQIAEGWRLEKAQHAAEKESDEMARQAAGADAKRAQDNAKAKEAAQLPAEKPKAEEAPSAPATGIGQLRYVRTGRLRFHILFDGRDASTNRLQVDSYEGRPPSQMLNVGDEIAGTPYKLVKFVPKTKTDENGIEHDVSELTIQNTETNEERVLAVGVDSTRDEYAVFKYLADGSEYTVDWDGQFSLKSDPDVIYRLIDVQKEQALIKNVTTGEEIMVPRLQSTPAGG